MNGDVVLADSFGANSNNESKWYGEEGNDQIWGAYGTLTGNQYYYGGNGDDQIFGANELTDGDISQRLIGQGGKDYIDTSWRDGLGLEQLDFTIVFGDWKYGDEDFENDFLQYPNFDEQLEKKL